jgi:hypothetical protein
MELQNIGHEALHLPKRGRARLIQRLPLCLKAPSAEALRSEDNFSVSLQCFSLSIGYREKSDICRFWRLLDAVCNIQIVQSCKAGRSMRLQQGAVWRK